MDGLGNIGRHIYGSAEVRGFLGVFGWVGFRIWKIISRIGRK